MLEVAVDIGGTFTDLVVYDSVTGQTLFGKELTTPGNLHQGVLATIDRTGADVVRANTFTHGTTVAINAMIERKGVKTALTTTEGFRDSIEIGRGNRPESFNVYYKRLEPLVPRELRFEVPERLNFKGEVLRPLDLDSLLPIIEELRREQVEAVAVCLLHAYANPAHEHAIANLLRERLPGVFVTASHEVSREFREYERTSTTIVNAYVGPIVARYLDALDEALRGRGFKGTFFMMESNGGVLGLDSAKAKPFLLMESGPVAGALASARIGEIMGHPNVVAFDMGGTTTKACLIEGGLPAVTERFYISGYARGYPIQATVLDIVEVGAGGGSIAWIDAVGALKVGPHSAGASPGPVCYGLGGAEPTITDANVVLGRLSPEYFLGGTMRLDRAAAERALAEEVAAPLGQDSMHIAEGILKIATHTMSAAVRLVTIERGRDPRDFVMVAGGGAGPMHAGDIAREIGIPIVIIPPVPGNFSAMGMLAADLRHDYVRTFVNVSEGSLEGIEEAFRSLEDEARAQVLAETPEVTDIAMTRYADMRYVGQEFTVRVPVPREIDPERDREAIKETFDKTYAFRYGHSAPHERAQVINIRLVAHGIVPRPSLSAIQVADGRGPGVGPQPTSRQVYLEGSGGFIQCPVYRRDTLRPRDRVQGPAIIEEHSSTTLLRKGDVAEVNDYGYLVIRIGREDA